ncbi:MAG: hypothetical protein N5P05_002401 [Chroococcopsis gigantea SAG 12.99]|jgi:glycosyltransferase involved in cell wall biosynthesis|nr:glycosyltransferase [Chlorogloea purpurea SAG 13.99]MDV3000795.1 hypothetical protein [Chroococcopsis gigantea SAG 12.99]
MHWTIAAPFFEESDLGKSQWLDDFVPGGQHSFTKIYRRKNVAHQSWHNRSSRNTPLAEWLTFWNQGGDAWHGADGGCITVFPQMANMVGLHKRLSSKNSAVVAWCFNVGALYPGIKQRLANFCLQGIDKFIVHSRRECETVSDWLKLPQSKFEFVPLQRAEIPVLASEDLDKPFVLSMGSANRDYPTFFKAVEKLKIRTVIVASQYALRGLNIPANVEVLSGLTPEQCHRLAQEARINVVPLVDHPTAAGQVTIIEAMRMSRPVIATRCIGSEDYIDHAANGLLVPAYSVDELAGAIDQLWSDEGLRTSLAREAGKYTRENLSDEAAGINLRRILDQFL